MEKVVNVRQGHLGQEVGKERARSMWKWTRKK